MPCRSLVVRVAVVIGLTLGLIGSAGSAAADAASGPAACHTSWWAPAGGRFHGDRARWLRRHGSRVHGARARARRGTIAGCLPAPSWGVPATAATGAPSNRSGIAPPAVPVHCTKFVSPSGSGGGSSASDPMSFAAAVAQVVPDDVVCVLPGTYTTTSNVEIDRSGTPGHPITFTGFGGVALLQYTGPAIDGGVLQTAFCKPWCGTHDLVIENLAIDGGGRMDAGVFVREGSHDVSVRHCMIWDTGATGIALNAVDHVTAARNLIYRTGYSQGWSSGISLWNGGPGATYGGASAWVDGAPGFHNFIVANVISGSYDNSPNHTDGNGIIVDGSGSIPPALIANNLVYENGGAGIEVYYNSGDIWVVNNTAYANGLDLHVSGGRSSDFVANNASHVHFVNDLAYGRQNGSSYQSAYLFRSVNGSPNNSAATLGYNGDSNLQGGYRNADPLFNVRPPIPAGPTPWYDATPPWQIKSDFTLRSGSPALGAGTNAVAGMSAAEADSAQAFLGIDLAGRYRPAQHPSIGAYQG
jgi:hypothetical protein